MKKFTPVIIIISGHLLLSACAPRLASDSLPGHRTARLQSSLELPPDLINTSSEALKQRQQRSASTTVLPEIAGITIKRNENGERWLAVENNADETWAILVDYTLKSGLPILIQNKQSAIIETDWIGDKTVDSGVNKLLGFFNRGGRATVNDKYTFWLERTADQQTALFVTHKQLKQVTKSRAIRGGIIETAWIEAPGDGLQTLTLLRDLKAFFGGDRDDDVTDNVVLISSATPSIILREEVDIARNRVREALLATGYELVAEKPKKNLIVFRAVRKKGGFFSNFTRRTKHSVKIETYGASEISGIDNKTKVTITSSSGLGIASKASLPILYQLAGELKK